MPHRPERTDALLRQESHDGEEEDDDKQDDDHDTNGDGYSE